MNPKYFLVVIMLMCGAIGYLISSTINTQEPVEGSEALLLKRSNDSLQTIVLEAEKESIKLQSKIDSLKQKKTKIITHYEIIYKNVDSMPVDSVIGEYHRLFAKEGDHLNWKHGDMLYR